MGIINVNKMTDAAQIDCEGTLKVTLELSAAPDISANPTDIVLVLDRSGSMLGSPLANLKAGADTFIDIIDETTDSQKDGVIGGGSHIGIVSFDGTAAADVPLSTSVSELKTAVDGLTAGGSTNHADAFAKAVESFDPASSNERVIVMFTDGKTTAGPTPGPVAEAAKAEGIIIYCIGLVGSDGINVDDLNDWATDPDSAHVAVTPDEEELEALFAELAKNISKPGATQITIDEILNPDFQIVSIDPPSKGSAEKIDTNSLQWKISELGVRGNEDAVLEFYVRHVGQTGGVKSVNQSLLYSDKENHSVTFPDPSVNVMCDAEVDQEKCPDPVEFSLDGCQDSLEVDLGDVYLESRGRILQLDVTLKKICPNRRTALAIVLTEVDCDGKEHSRGMKTLTVPAHHYPGCRDIKVKCIKFVVPEDLNVCGSGMCKEKKFKARVIANSIDTDFKCCETAVTL